MACSSPCQTTIPVFRDTQVQLGPVAASRKSLPRGKKGVEVLVSHGIGTDLHRLQAHSQAQPTNVAECVMEQLKKGWVELCPLPGYLWWVSVRAPNVDRYVHGCNKRSVVWQENSRHVEWSVELMACHKDIGAIKDWQCFFVSVAL